MGTLAVTAELHAKQQEGARKEAERAARKAPQDAAADATGEAGEPASKGFDRPEQSSSRSIRNRRPSVPGSSRATCHINLIIVSSVHQGVAAFDHTGTCGERLQD